MDAAHGQRIRISRRRFMASAAALGAWPLAMPCADAHTSLPPPEVRRLRLAHTPAMCLAPQYLAEQLLLAEGFESVEYVANQPAPKTYSKVTLPDIIANGLVDISMAAAPGVVATISSGGPLTVVGGIHAGCYDLYAHSSIRALRDLKHRSIAATALGEERLFVGSMLAYVGIHPLKDVNWVTTASQEASMALFLDNKVDAFLGFPPQPQEMRRRKAGHLLLRTVTDRPWSQYFCCMVAAHREFVQRNPVASKRALRALLKAADICANEPVRAARFMVEAGHVPDYQDALGLVNELPYRRWRDADPEDTLRFFALRLHDVGMIDATPKKIIADGTDWRFLNELKREMKA